MCPRCFQSELGVCSDQHRATIALSATANILILNHHQNNLGPRILQQVQARILISHLLWLAWILLLFPRQDLECFIYVPTDLGHAQPFAFPKSQISLTSNSYGPRKTISLLHSTLKIFRLDL